MKCSLPRSARLATFAAFLPIALAACASSDKGAAPLGVTIPADCIPSAALPDPGVPDNVDAEVALARNRAALAAARRALKDTAVCQEAQRERFRKGG